MTHPEFGVILLAAGLGKRMQSSKPKILSEISGRPMIFHLLDRIAETGRPCSIALVVGYGHEEVRAAIAKESRFQKLDISYVHQAEQQGTGDAAKVAVQSEWGEKVTKLKIPILVLPGDSPLVSSSLIQEMAEPLPRGCAMRLLTVTILDPTGYGRVVRKGKDGPVLRIVEERDAQERERAIQEVAASIYLFDSHFLKAAVRRLNNKNAQNEYYLTDLVGVASSSKKKITVLRWMNSDDVRGVNTPWDLTLAGKILNRRCLQGWALQGVRFVDPENTWVDLNVRFSKEVVVYPGVCLQGKTTIGERAIIGPKSVIKDSEVGAGAEIKVGCVIDDSRLGGGCKVGPYAHLRPGSKVGQNCKIGNFVELKNSSIGDRTSVAHLSYIGDAEVGSDCNIGCGFVTCNYDGRTVNGERKHKTKIGNHAFIGSDCQTIAPVEIKNNAYVASGSTITEDVPGGALAIARARQVNKPDYAKRLLGKDDG